MDIFSAVARNDIPLLYSFLKYDFNDPNERNDRGLTGLHICATYGHIEAAGLLLEYGADLSLKDYESGYTPLHRAFYHGQYKIAWFFIRSGAILDVDVDEYCNTLPLKSATTLSTITDCKDWEGFTPLGLLSTTLSSSSSNSLSSLSFSSLSFTNHSSHQKYLPRQTSVFAFGKADYQLGVALPKSSSDVLRPKRIHSLSSESIVQLVANKHHSMALTFDGRAYSWGHGKNGRLGHGGDRMQLEPMLIIGFQSKIISVSAGLNHSLALSENGDLFSWGSDRCGQIGHGLCNSDIGIIFEPKKIESIRKEHVIGISAGDYHSICHTRNGDIFCWGSNKVGQLGFKATEVSSSQSGCPIVPYPKRIVLRSMSKISSRMHVVQVVAAYNTTTALIVPYLTDDDISRYSIENEVYQWGNGCYTPMKVKFPSATSTQYSEFDKRSLSSVMVCDKAINIIQLASGKFHSVGVSDIGHVYTWGLGSDQLGYESNGTSYYSPPRLVEALLSSKGGGKIVYVAATANRTCSISDKGDLHTWGATDDQGILGHSVKGSYQPIPKRVGGVKRAIRVALGEDHTLVLTDCVIPPLPLDSFYKQISVVDPSIPSHQRLNESGDEKSDDSDEEDGDDNSDSRDNDGDRPSMKLNTKKYSYKKMYLPQKKNNVADITDTTDMIEVPTLKQFCERKLAQLTDTKYIPIFYSISETFEASLLRNFCDQFIRMNFDAILTQAKPHDLDLFIKDHDYHRLLIDSNDLNSTSSSSTSKRPRSYSKDNTINISVAQKPVRSRSYSVDLSDNESSALTKSKVKASPNSENYDSKEATNAFRKDLDSVQSVSKLIKSVKKKLNSIEELLTINPSNLTKEQMEKIQKQSSLQSELSRLELIFNRLKREEEILEKAKSVRKEVATEKNKDINLSKPDSDEFSNLMPNPILDSELFVTNIMNLSTKDPSHSESSSVEGNFKVIDITLTEISQLSLKTEVGEGERDKVDILEDTNKSKKSWNKSSNETNTTSSKGFISDTLFPTLGEMKNLSTVPTKLPLSSIGIHGQTVLSPPITKITMTSEFALSSSSPSPKSSANPTITKTTMQPSIVGNKSIVTPISSSVGIGITLAAFIPQKTMVPTPEKVMVKPVSSTTFKWGTTSPITPSAKPSTNTMITSNNQNSGKSREIQSLWYDSPDHSNIISNTSTLHDKKSTTSSPSSSSTFLDIQREEENMKLQSSMGTYGNSSSRWFVERRPRAPSIDEVIKVQEKQRMEDERNRQEEIELQEALQAIAEAEKREQKEKERKGKQKQRQKQHQQQQKQKQYQNQGHTKHRNDDRNDMAKGKDPLNNTNRKEPVN